MSVRDIPGHGESSHGHGPIRLPRLNIMDDRSMMDHGNRNRSLSSGSQPGMAAFAPWSPDSEHQSQASGSMSEYPSPPGSFIHRSVSAYSNSPNLPKLPTPARRSTMMDGSLPPLAVTAGGEVIGGSRNESMRHDPTYPHPSVSHGFAAAGRVGPASVYTPAKLPASASYPSSSADHLGRPRSLAAESSPPVLGDAQGRKLSKAHVSSACLNCKRAHLACDAERPCRRCTKLGKTATCVDVQHKKRGRPRLKDREMANSSPLEMPLGAGAWPPRPHSSSSSSAYFGQHHPVGVYASGASEAAGSVGPAHSGHMMAAQPVESRARSYSSSSTTRTVPRPPPPMLSPPTRAPREHVQYSHGRMRRRVPVATVLCGTNLTTAQVSREFQEVFGLQPSYLIERPLIDLVHPEDVDRFEACWSRLVQPVGIAPSAFPAIAEEMMRTSSCFLLEPARGTIFIEDTFRMRTAGDMWGLCSVRLHLGAAFGLDLYRPETKSRAYVVCSALVVSSDEDVRLSSKQHPDLVALRSAEFPPTHRSLIAFDTPLNDSVEHTGLPRSTDGDTAGYVNAPPTRSYSQRSTEDLQAQYQGTHRQDGLSHMHELERQQHHGMGPVSQREDGPAYDLPRRLSPVPVPAEELKKARTPPSALQTHVAAVRGTPSPIEAGRMGHATARSRIGSPLPHSKSSPPAVDSKIAAHSLQGAQSPGTSATASHGIPIDLAGTSPERRRPFSTFGPPRMLSTNGDMQLSAPARPPTSSYRPPAFSKARTTAAAAIGSASTSHIGASHSPSGMNTGYNGVGKARQARLDIAAGPRHQNSYHARGHGHGHGGERNTLASLSSSSVSPGGRDFAFAPRMSSTRGGIGGVATSSATSSGSQDGGSIGAVAC